MWAAEVAFKGAERVRQYLLRKNLLHPDFLLVKEFGRIYFPLIGKASVPLAKVVETRFSFPPKEKPPRLEELLQGKLSAEELKIIPRSQEIVGQILILEIPEKLKKKEKVIAEAFLRANKAIRTVVKKEETHTGEYRLRKVRVLAGRNTKEAIHHENGVQMRLHLEKTYFSARLAGERLRIARQVKKGEEILVMFSGTAPYLLVLAKNSPARMVYGVEINPLAHQYARENISLNQLDHQVKIFLGDVREILPTFKVKFDRIIMPLPKTGKEFLDVALTKAKKGTVISFYTFLEEKGIAEEARKIKKICRQCKHPVRVLNTVKCGQFSPYVYRVCFDLKVLK